jgi:membrane-bound serine protease (ClpP class)
MNRWGSYCQFLFEPIPLRRIGVLVVLLLGLPQLEAQDGVEPKSEWLVTEIGIIGTASEDILDASIEMVLEQGLQGLVIKLDTPGGALENTRKMVKAMMRASFPVIVWVGPSGSRAGSAGAFITIAGHVAAMAKGTNIGAAHPIGADGKDVSNKELNRKVMNDTLAFIESIAEERGRNIEMARSFVATSASITAEEALKNQVIDHVENSLADLFVAIDGKEIKLQDGSVILNTKSAKFIYFEKSFRQKALEILSNPNLFYLLFMAGLIGIGYELTHPGAMVPGVIGGVSLILAFIATSVLPVSWGAAALIILGAALLVAEAFVPSFGVLGIGGFTAFVLGSIFLVDPQNEQGLRVDIYTWAPGTIVVGLAFLALGFLILRSERAPAKSGRESMLGAVAEVLDFADGHGRIRFQGSIWQAKSGDQVSFEQGERVKVKALDGLTITVEKDVTNNEGI